MRIMEKHFAARYQEVCVHYVRSMLLFLQVVCARCSPNIVSLPQIGIVKAARVCTHCYLQYLGQAARMTLDLTQSVQVH